MHCLRLLLFMAFAHICWADMIQMYINMGKRTAIKIINNTVGENECGNDLRSFIDGVINMQNWALEMLDASDKIASGYLTGSVRQSGNYDECLAVKTIKNETVIQGKYCLYGISLNVTGTIDLLDLKNQLKLKGIKVRNFEKFIDGIKATASVCVPLSCTTNDLKLIWNYTRYTYGLKIDLLFDEGYCDYDGRVHFEKSDILAFVFFASIGALVCLSTVYDYLVYQRTKKSGFNLLIAFSFYTNSKKLISLKDRKDPLACVHGIQVFSMTWIILCHGYFINLAVPNINGLYILEWKDQWENMLILGGNMAIDTFLVISGVSTIYSFLKSNEENGKINIIAYLLHRFIRLTPSLAAILLNLTTLFKFLSSGPYWHIFFKYVEENCDKYWWTTVLYIQNFYKPLDQCLPHGWYLSVDMQLYVLAPIILYPLIKWPKKVLTFITILIFLSMTTAFCNTWIMKLGATPYEVENNYFQYMYQATYTRASAWLIGAFTGYILYQTKDSIITIPKWTNLLIWFSCLFVTSSTVFGQIMFIKNDYDVLKAAIFNTIARPAWSIAICYIILACVHGYAGFINSILTFPILQVISRLTYSMYLVHLGVLGVSINAKRTVSYFNNLTMLQEFWGNFINTILYSFGWTLTFESPVIALEKYFKSLKKPKTVYNMRNAEDISLPQQNKQQE